MWTYLWIGLGGALGSVGRFWLSEVTARQSAAFPWGTLLVNVSGSFAIGFFATLTGPEGRWFVPPTGRHVFMAGLCGGYTTFSAFSLQTLQLMQQRQWLYAAGNAGLSLVLCLIGVWMGHALAASLNANTR